jgi:phage-related protein
MSETKTAGSWVSNAKCIAREAAREIADDILAALAEKGEVDEYSTDHDAADEFIFSGAADQNYSLLEAAQILEDLADWEETDSGLWQGLPPRDAVTAQAAWTLRAASCDFFGKIMAAVNEDARGGILADMIGEDDPACEYARRGRLEEIIDSF